MTGGKAKGLPVRTTGSIRSPGGSIRETKAGLSSVRNSKVGKLGEIGKYSLFAAVDIAHFPQLMSDF